MQKLIDKIASRQAVVSIIGLGYVGLPLAVAAAQAGYQVLGIDSDTKKVALLQSCESYIEAVGNDALTKINKLGLFRVSSDYSSLAEADVIVVCVPTPLSAQRMPDLSMVETALSGVEANLRGPTVVILESTTYPGTTTEFVVPFLQTKGRTLGKDLFVGFSPEREDPGNKNFNTKNIPKIVSGCDGSSAKIIAAFYRSFLSEVVLASSPEVAEAAKITENVFRAVNIALVNELKVVFSEMGIDVWEVIDAASTKPFGYMPFYPGPGLGGHCIPVDPYYLSWKAREFGVTTQFIELAGEVNMYMPSYVIEHLRKVLDTSCGLALSRSNILVVGASYKKNVGDLRESPALEIIDRIHRLGANVECLDPHVEELTGGSLAMDLNGHPTIHADQIASQEFDVVLILTDHDAVDYRAIFELDIPIIDTRNAMGARGFVSPRVTKA